MAKLTPVDLQFGGVQKKKVLICFFAILKGKLFICYSSIFLFYVHLAFHYKYKVLFSSDRFIKTVWYPQWSFKIEMCVSQSLLLDKICDTPTNAQVTIALSFISSKMYSRVKVRLAIGLY